MRENTAERVRGVYNYRHGRFVARSDDGGADGIKERSADFQQLPMELLRAQGQTLIRLRNEGKIGDGAMHRIERDLETSRNPVGGPKWTRRHLA